MHIKTAVPMVIVQKKAAAMCLRFHHQPQKQIQRTVKKLHKKQPSRWLSYKKKRLRCVFYQNYR